MTQHATDINAQAAATLQASVHREHRAPSRAALTHWRFWALVGRIVVGTLFFTAAAGKLANLPQFAKEIRAYELVPAAITPAMAYVLAWLEIIAATLLILCILRREARLWIFGLLVVFTAAKIYIWSQGMTIDCGCVGDNSMLKWYFENPQGIVTNLVLMVLLGVDAYSQHLRGRFRRAYAPSGS